MGLLRAIERHKDDFNDNSNIYIGNYSSQASSKFTNAQESYAGTRCIDFLYDHTFFGSATDGFAISNGEISFCIYGKKGRAHFSEMSFLVIEEQNKIGFYAPLKDIDIMFPVSSSLIKKFQLLRELISENSEW